MVVISITLFLIVCTNFINAQYYNEYECNDALLERAQLSATSSMSGRGPENAVLYGGGAWSARDNDFSQYLIVDLGQVMNVTRIWTQGRPHTNEYVMEYTISYGTNGQDYADYKESGGDKMSPCLSLGHGAWAPTESTYFEKLTVDLGGRYEIRAIATQGRGRNDFVSEYIVEYSDDGEQWRSFQGADGEVENLMVNVIMCSEEWDADKYVVPNKYVTVESRIYKFYKKDLYVWHSAYSTRDELRLAAQTDCMGKMFRGNSDGDTVHKNEFEVPIIAQWIRINPTRWRDRISLRVELFGCEYDAYDMYFNGSSLLKYDLYREPIAALRETIRFRFKTTTPNGVVLYSRGTQGDYLALQLRDNRMLLNINLGSNEVTSLSVGSLLDDNIWHDVVISRNRRDILFSVDRVVVQDKIKGEFQILNLNTGFYIGGVSNIQEGLVVVQNYTGCIENLYLNSTNLMYEVKEALQYGESYKYQKVNTLWTCPEPQIVPVTFKSHQAHARLKGYEGMTSLNSSFAFRTYEDNGLMLYHAFSGSGYVAVYLAYGKLKVELITANNPKVILDNYNETFNDGKWHTVVLAIQTNKIVFSVDYRPMVTTRQLKIITGSTYFIAGGIMAALGYSNTVYPGFIGCMRTIKIDGNSKLPSDWSSQEYCCADDVLFDACHMTDRCNPNPCQHGGVCKQNSMEFMCDCRGTGYGGAVCHTSINPLSCLAYKNVQAVGPRAEIKVDVDGSGPLAPFPVTCEFYADGKIATVVHHANEQTTSVDGFQEPGSFVQDIRYEADEDQIIALINRSSTCRQHLEYACRNSKLLNSPSDEANFRPFSWWVSGRNRKADYWGGALPGSRMCECGINSACADPRKWCNCDTESDVWQVDGGDIIEKEDLPVKQLRFGDTGSALDDKEGRYTLGPLICEGDDLFNNVVTFRIADATINLPTFDMGHSGDIYFEFRTASHNAVLFHSKGPTDYIKLSIVNGDNLIFEYQAGAGPQTVVSRNSYRLADDRWHSVSVERNRKEAMLIIDGSLRNELREPPGPVRALHLTSDLVIGATTDYRDGFTGCIRALLINGKPIDLRSYAKLGLYGISEGCVGKCQSNPCLNNGTCHERYDSYMCDCRWTAFKGPICADEIGVNLKSSSMVKYEFEGSFRSTIAEKIRVGFTTTNPKGFLLGMSSNITGEYMTIMVSNSGHLRVVFDFGFERQEVIYPEKHFGLGQYHDLRLSRKNAGSTLVMQVDNYAPKEFTFHVKASADAQFNNIQYLYIGRNESMTEGFIGCVSRVEFDDIYPLKLLFQQQGPGNVRSIGGNLNEDYCGVEPITHPPEQSETRPPPPIDEDKLRRAYNQVDSALIGSILAILFLLLVLVVLLIGRYLHRHKGEYVTQEDAGAEMAPDPDTAVVQGATGHHVEPKKEWFI